MVIINGEIPKWLKGSLIRVGSGLLEVGPDRYNHVFDGLALMHKFCFEDGRVTYRNRFLRSDSYKKNMKANRIVVTEFATPGIPDPCKTIFQRFASLFSLDDLTDNDLVNIILYADEAYACSESNCIWRIDPDTLESLQKTIAFLNFNLDSLQVKLNRFVPVNAATAHAHEDTDGTVYNVGSTFGYSCSYNILKFPPKRKEVTERWLNLDLKQGSCLFRNHRATCSSVLRLEQRYKKSDNGFQNASLICKIPSTKTLGISYHHSFGMSENYFIFVEQPLYLSIPRLMWSHFVAGTYADAMYWDDDRPTRFHVVRRSDNQLLDTVYVSKRFSWRSGQDLVHQSSGGSFQQPPSIPNLSCREARGFILPLNVDEKKGDDENLITLSNSEATAVQQSDGSIYLKPEILTASEPWSPELPRINYDYNGRKYKYFYAMARNDTLERTHLIKVDVTAQKTISWNDQAEDSGILIASLLFQTDETKVAMVVLDARTMKEIGRVTFKTESSVPGDFHGTFIPKN
ncbi:beta,beta-carotene 9',10'-oxygenase [Caerostris extrusa]|uniref:Beta,beta-carotene 9',10'-oxygenase n=1 Tax=Caerostris extrusa TaxID=172846 RepID=A0AAV4U590_CAEEX|nr:beta,beta-carotene 9',10'-oxygenase [Caerostris extrusa]